MNSPLTIGEKPVSPPLLLAPMMDITGKAFRACVRRYGGCGLYYSEMLNSRRVPSEKDNAPILSGFGQEDDLVIQLLGKDPDFLKASVERLEAFKPWGYDLNMGCSRAAIVRHGWGAALLSNQPQAAAAIRAMRRATAKPLTVKIRIGWKGMDEAKSFLAMIEAEGVDAVIIHPRTPEKIFTRPAKWEWINKLKSCTTMPVIGNGDVRSVDDAFRMIAQTHCDGLMIGRGAVADPTLMRTISARLGNTPLPKPVSKLEIFKSYVEQLGATADEPKRVAELRTFCRYFAQGLPVPHWFWGPLQGKRQAAEIIAIGRDFLERNGL